MNRTEWTRALQVRARELGFDLVGIAPAAPAASAEAYQNWLAHGYAGEMAYLARPDAVAKRRDPRFLLPTARSIIVVGMNYYTEVPERGGWRIENGEWKMENGEWKMENRDWRMESFSPLQSPFSNLHSPISILHSPSPIGLISRYAWGDDYHEVIAARLEELAAFLEAMVGRGGSPGLSSVVEWRLYVDTGPLLEREWAVRAGLGWIGKNTNLLNRQWGSWLFLGEILTSLELDYDVPASAHCGSCTRCLEACPTGALVAPYVLDARRCISYLTIELKGPIPRDLRPLMGNWIFGCDLCQEVCPWNRRHARPTGEAAFRPRPGLLAPELIPLLQLTPEEFAARFRGSPLRRARRRGLLRNVAVALGNWGNPAAIPALSRALRDPEPLIRGHAAWALGRFGGAGQAALREALAGEEDPWVREEIILALGP